MTRPTGEVRAWTFGTAADCDVRVDDPYVSKHHCRVTEDESGEVWIEDLGSMNGTFVDGVRVHDKRRIQPGCLVRIGRQNIPYWDREEGRP